MAFLNSEKMCRVSIVILQDIVKPQTVGGGKSPLLFKSISMSSASLLMIFLVSKILPAPIWKPVTKQPFESFSQRRDPGPLGSCPQRPIADRNKVIFLLCFLQQTCCLHNITAEFEWKKKSLCDVDAPIPVTDKALTTLKKEN